MAALLRPAHAQDRHHNKLIRPTPAGTAHAAEDNDLQLAAARVATHRQATRSAFVARHKPRLDGTVAVETAAMPFVSVSSGGGGGGGGPGWGRQ